MRNYSGFSKVSDLWIQDILCFRTFRFAMDKCNRTFLSLPGWVQKRADEATRSINYYQDDKNALEGAGE
jgi:hypothetical protein